jgi:hypothetical protein
VELLAKGLRESAFDKRDGGFSLQDVLVFHGMVY